MSLENVLRQRRRDRAIKKEIPWKCPQCGEQFKYLYRRGDMTRGLIKLSSEKHEEFSIDTYQCQTCGCEYKVLNDIDYDEEDT